MQNTRKLNITNSEDFPCELYKSILGSGGKTPSILASARDRSGLLHALGRFSHKEKADGTHLIRGWVYRRTSKYGLQKKINLPLFGYDPRFFGCPNRLLLTVSAVPICLAHQQQAS